MKRTILAVLLAAGAIASAPSFAAGPTWSPGATSPRTIHITPETKYINVIFGETVNLDISGTTHTVRFDDDNPVQNLSALVPGAPSVRVYVVPSTRYNPGTGG